MDNISGYVGEWELIRKLGDGGFGQVLLWRHKSSNQEVATKLLKSNNTLQEEHVAKLKERWLKEIEWIRNLNTPHIVRGIELNDKDFEQYLDSNHAWKPLPVLKMEYCNGGDLRTLLRKVENTNGLHEQEVRAVLLSLSHAINYLHSICRIEHRDLKPDNIVIHRNGNTRTYKLTDFGFARELSETTILKSVVGTCHYLAPEIIDTSQYTHTVDYWSAGVIAFEIMCGCLPFIPHQSIYNIITNIKNKPKSCIAIIENMNESNRFLFEQHVFPENRMSPIFLRRIEEWLRLALDNNYKTRGKCISPTATGDNNNINDNNNTIEFYSVLDSVLMTKILRIFCLNTGKFYYYELTSSLTMLVLHRIIQRDTSLNHFEFILPVGHPHSHITAATQPTDLFVDEWQDTSKTETPPAMLYIVCRQCDYNIGDPRISLTIKTLMKDKSTPAQKTNWKLRTYMQNTHFLLSNEQCHLEAHLHGLKEFAMTVENDLFDFENYVHNLSTRIAMIIGEMNQFNIMIEAARHANCSEITDYDNFHTQWLVSCEQLKTKLDKLTLSDATITKRYKSALRRAKEQAQNSEFQKWIENDIYNISSFHNYMQGNGRNISIEKCQKAVENCLKERHRFYAESNFIKDQKAIWNVSKEFVKIREVVTNAFECVNQLHNEIINATSSFQLSLRHQQIPQNVPAVNFDGSLQPVINGFHSNGFCDESVKKLIQETMQFVELSKMDVDVGDVEDNDVPTTIDLDLNQQ